MTVLQMQCLLRYLGYDTGGIDGISGAKTKAALEQFRADYGCGEEGLVGAVGLTVPKLEKPSQKSVWDEVKHFSRNEYKCTCKGKYCNGFPVEPDEALVRLDEQIRVHFGVPITITSGIRCPKRNTDPDVRGESNSQHLYGKASDLSIPGVPPQAAAAYVETLMPNTGGIGIYPWGIHVDTRKEKARWRG